MVGELKKNKLKDLIEIEGGPGVVSEAVGVSRITLWTWTTKGFPHTDYSGFTNHSTRLANFFTKQGHTITADEILELGGA